MLDEPRYLRLATEAFKRIEDALEDVDPGVVDLDAGGDVVTLTLANGIRCVVNTQRTTRQIWLAARANAWHFSFDEASGTWLDDKGRGDELFATLGRIVKEHSAADVAF